MDKYKALARIIESLLACLIIVLTMSFTNPYFASNTLITSKSDKKDLASHTLAYLLYTGILKEISKGNYFLLVNATEKIIPIEYGFKISIYDSTWSLIWSYQRSNFNEAYSESSYIALNTYEDSKITIKIIVLAIS